MKADILKDNLRLLVTNAVVKPAWFVFILISARILGPEAFGLYSLAVLLVSVVFIVFELGVDVNAFKTLASSDERDSSIISKAFMAKAMILSTCGFILISLSFFLEPKLGGLVRIAVPFVIAYMVMLFVRHLFRAHIWFDLESRSIIAERMITITFGSFALWLSSDVRWYLSAFVAGYGLTVAHDLFHFIKKSGFKFQANPLREVFKLIVSGASVGIYNALGMIFSRISSLVFYIGGMPTSDIGRFTAGNRLFDSFALLPTIITEPLYPRMCKAIHNRDQLTDLVRFPAVFQFAFGTLTAMVALTHHETLIGFLLGPEYAVASLEIALTFSVIMAFTVTTITSKLIIAAGQERMMSRILLVFTISQILLLFAASQFWGLMGVVLVYVAHEFLYSFVLSVIAFRWVKIAEVVSGYAMVMLSAVASIGIHLLLPSLHPLLAISLHIASFGVMLFLTRILRIDHITRLYAFIRRRDL